VVERLAVKLKGVSSNPGQGYNFLLFFAKDERGFLSVRELAGLCDQPQQHAGVYHVSIRFLRVFRVLVFLSVAAWCRVFVHAVQL